MLAVPGDDATAVRTIMQGLWLTQAARDGGEGKDHSGRRGDAQTEGRRGIRDSYRRTWALGMIVFIGEIPSGDSVLRRLHFSSTSITESSEMGSSLQASLMIETMADLGGLLAWGGGGHHRIQN